MELLNLPELAERSGLPLSKARYFRDRFLLFVPSVRVRGSVLHPLEAVDTLRTISDIAASGATAPEIERMLGDRFPITVVTAQPVESAQTRPATIDEDQKISKAAAEESATLATGAEQIRQAV